MEDDSNEVNDTQGSEAGSTMVKTDRGVLGVSIMPE